MEWHRIPTDAPGLKKPGPSQPRQAFRIAYQPGRILVDLSGLALDQTVPGMAELGTLPSRAEAALSEQTWWVNDDPSGLHQSVVALHQGRVLYWVGSIRKGLLAVNRPASLHGGLEFTPKEG